MPMETVYVERREFEEYKRRLEDKKNDWDKGLDEVKADVKELRELTTAVSKLAQSIETMAKEQERMVKEQGRLGEHVEAIEKRDGEMWRKFIGYVVTAIVTAVTTFFFARFGR